MLSLCLFVFEMFLSCLKTPLRSSYQNVFSAPVNVQLAATAQVFSMKNYQWINHCLNGIHALFRYFCPNFAWSTRCDEQLQTCMMFSNIYFASNGNYQRFVIYEKQGLVNYCNSGISSPDELYLHEKTLTLSMSEQRSRNQQNRTFWKSRTFSRYTCSVIIAFAEQTS